MKIINIYKTTIYITTLCLLLVSCTKKEEPTEANSALLNHEKVVRDLQTDFWENRYFNLRTGTIVEQPAGDNWDIAFEFSQLKVNGGNMGSPARQGNAKGILLNVPYASVTEIPNLSNLKQDNGKDDFALGINNGGKSWYYMDENTFYIPYAEKTLFLQTADGEGFAKIQILGFYRGMPNLKGETYDSMSSRAGFYTFRYQYVEKGQKFH